MPTMRCGQRTITYAKNDYAILKHNSLIYTNPSYCFSYA